MNLFNGIRISKSQQLKENDTKKGKLTFPIVTTKITWELSELRPKWDNWTKYYHNETQKLSRLA